jgi:hypothetical protein
MGAGLGDYVIMSAQKPEAKAVESRRQTAAAE